MLGFLGTVIGMIFAFDTIQASGDIKPDEVAGGIKIALITTVFGLIVAMILQIFYNLITSKVDDLSNKMEDKVIKNGKEIALTRLEFDLLAALAKEPGRVFTREALLSEVWGYQHAADTRLVNVHVQRLRSKIESDADNPEYVLTVRGVGYKAGAAKV
jgi:uncharacterized membrane protein